MLAVLGVAGCDAMGIGGGADRESVSLSFAVPGAGAARSVGVAAAQVPITGGGHTVDLQQVDVLFSELVLERSERSGQGGDSDGDSERDSDSDGPSNNRFRSGPATVALPLGGGTVTPISESLPLGAYEELEIDVAQVRLRGTYDGQPFDVTVPVDAELEAEFEPPFQVASDADRLNLTVRIDALTWLRNSDGTVADPRALAANRDLRERVVRRIEASFRAFEDSDRDADEADSDSDRR